MGVFVFESENFVLVLLLCVLELQVPVLVELLVLLDMCLLALLPLLLVHEDHLLHLARILLLFQLSDPVLCHLGLNIAPLKLTSASVFLHRSALKSKQ